MFPETIESERLTFERLSHDSLDARALYEVFGANPDADEIFEYVDSDPHRTVKESYDLIQRAQDAFEDGEWVQYAIRPTEGEPHAGELAGIAGLYPKWDRRVATLGIILDTRFWGRGYSGERAAVFLELAFDRLDLDLVAVKYIDGNERSKRAVERYVDRFGGRYVGLLRNDLAVEGEVFDCHRYSISRAEYEESKRG
ncbi:GNAT family N-acetyltransferase [Halovivax gelatinilyticus]|uniref:GNAT family N-acetyltransferase n=1 Tax=Halovivax gelatinilyticus TaxID=2961597 RepID=UPI0020CA2C82|nr:GNAT family protein [Halovivax gelatinilyticus]